MPGSGSGTRTSSGLRPAAGRGAQGGTPVAEVRRKMAVSEATFFRWKKQLTGMGVCEIRRLKQFAVEERATARG